MARALSRHDPFGLVAEQLAREALEGLGWVILATNLHVGRAEIDLLARDGETLVLVEVRGRGPSSWQRPLDSVDAGKRARLRAAGEHLWRAHYACDGTLQRMRFDLFAVTWGPGGEASSEHVRAAF